MTSDDKKQTSVDIQVGTSISGRTESQTTKVRKKREVKHLSVHPKTNIKIGRHGAEMIMTTDPENNERMLSQVGIPEGWETPATMEERLRLVQKIISQSMGISLDESQVPAKIGFDISTESQRKLLFGVLRLMTESDYRGTYQKPNEQVLRETGKDPKSVEAETKGYKVLTGTEFGGVYENIPSTPIIKISDRDLMIESGFNPDSDSDKENFSKAKGDLSFKQNFLMYTRFARDEKGRVIKDRNGRTKFELVSMFSPVLIIKSVADPQTKKHLYNEISPAPVFLDEISRIYGATNGGYFLLIPSDSMEEITRAYRRRFPNRKGYPPTIVHSLCWWFRLRVVDIQNRERNPFTKKKGESSLRISFFDLCRQMDFGEKAIKKNRSRIRKQLSDGIEVAQELGYISGWSFNEETDEYIFDLNLEYYPNGYKSNDEPDEQTQQEEPQEKSQGPPEEQGEPQQGTIQF